MTRSQKRRRKYQRFESAGPLVLGPLRVERALESPWPVLRRLRNAFLLIAIVGGVGASWVLLDDRFYVFEVDVVGAVRVSPNDVFVASDLPGLHILWVKRAESEARILAAHPGLASAEVDCALPAECTIAVVERQPTMTWQENGQMWWLDAEGVVFPAEGTLSEGWLVRGPLPRGEDGRLDERVHVALSELWASGAEMSPVLDYLPTRGLVVIDGRGWRVIVGKGSGIEERLQVLELLAADLQGRGLTPRYVDVRFPKAPYYSLTNDW